MDNTKIASKIFGLIFPVLKSKAAKKIGEEVSDAFNNETIAIWDKIKFIFIKEDKNLLEDLEKKPENANVQGAFKYKMENIIKDNEALKIELEDLIKKADKKSGNNSISNSKNINLGNITGNSNHIGDIVNK